MLIKKIFIVDDFVIECYVLVILFEGKGYIIVIVSNGEEGVVVVKCELFDLILMDVVMLGMNGY